MLGFTGDIRTGVAQAATSVSIGALGLWELVEKATGDVVATVNDGTLQVTLVSVERHAGANRQQSGGNSFTAHPLFRDEVISAGVAGSDSFRANPPLVTIADAVLRVAGARTDSISSPPRWCSGRPATVPSS